MLIRVKNSRIELRNSTITLKRVRLTPKTSRDTCMEGHSTRGTKTRLTRSRLKSKRSSRNTKSDEMDFQSGHPVILI